MNTDWGEILYSVYIGSHFKPRVSRILSELFFTKDVTPLMLVRTYLTISGGTDLTETHQALGTVQAPLTTHAPPKYSLL